MVCTERRLFSNDFQPCAEVMAFKSQVSQEARWVTKQISVSCVSAVEREVCAARRLRVWSNYRSLGYS